MTERMQRAVAALQQDDFVAAEPLFRELNRRWPDFADAWHFYGLLLHRRGDSAGAIQRLSHAQELAPGNVGFQLNFARVLFEAGRTAQSAACLDHAHALRPEDGRVLTAWAQSLLARRRGDEAAAELTRFLEKRDGGWRQWMLLGECREQGGEREAALAAYGEAARRAPPGEPAARLQRGDAANRAARPELAAKEFRAALGIAPSSAKARLALAYMAIQDGAFDTAETLLRDALAREPDLCPAWVALATAHQSEDGDSLAEELDAAAERAGAQPGAWALHIARGQLWEKRGRYAHAFEAYALGNRMHHAKYPYQPQRQLDYTHGVMESIDAGFARRASSVGQSNPGVIFVCGMPRSGTTLVETILAAHAEVRAGGEQTWLSDRLRREGGQQAAETLGNWVGSASDETLRTLASDWRRMLAKQATGARHITDKLPGNFARLGLIHVCFPDAPIVYVRRDARDNCFSCFATAFADRHEFAYDQEALAHFYRLHERLMEHWRSVLGARRIIEVEYERLVADPESEIRRLLGALGLAWDARCLAFHQVRRKVQTASAAQVRRPLYTSSVGRWRHFERELEPLCTALAAPPPL
ncbi:MAG: sulfotransferase [Gammaproteobacteria bacterium]|nr:sulfotransferase [Gammaproteobacteria bacterium]